jgi:hypothetical protein
VIYQVTVYANRKFGLSELQERAQRQLVSEKGPLKLRVTTSRVHRQADANSAKNKQHIATKRCKWMSMEWIQRSFGKPKPRIQNFFKEIS